MRVDGVSANSTTSATDRPARSGSGHFGRCSHQPKVADGASELLQDAFGKDKSPCRLVHGVASLPLGTSVELEIIFELAG